jgi:hypothetical protein
LRKVPCFIVRFSKVATPFLTDAVTLSGIENTKDDSLADPVQTNPDCRVSMDVEDFGVAVKDTIALAAVLDFGTYPILLASAITFSLNVAESKKDSFAIMLELNAVI